MTSKDNKQKRLEKIAEEIEKCSKCKKGKIGKAVPGEGSPNAEIVFVGEAPGKEEARTGRPFVGRSGKLLRSLIKEISLSPDKIYITSPVKYLPTYGTPKKSDILHGKTHLLKQLKIIDPKLIVLLGNIACQALLDKSISITKEHGKIIKKDNKHASQFLLRNKKYFITFHPAAALRFPKIKKLFVSDFQKLKDLIRLESVCA